jgi:type IV secretion system protein VirB9
MTIRTLRAVALAAMMACGTAHALTVPVSTPQDKHLQVVPFTTDVIAVQGEIGIMSVIHFGDGEVIKDYGMGDKSAWNVKFDGNQIAFVPKAEQGDTNMYVVTNRHKYWFSIAMTAGKYPVVGADEEDTKKGRAKVRQVLPTTWQLDLQYPVAEQQRVAAKDPAMLATKAKRNIETAFERAKREGRLDADYGYIGDDELLPTAAYNNGEMTYLVFAPTVALPTVYEKDADGTETRVGKHMEGDMMVIHTVARKLIIRRGKLVGCLIDGQFQPTGANSNTNTISPDVRRELNQVGTAEAKE